MISGVLDSTGLTQAFTVVSKEATGFDIGISMSGTNSVTLERNFGGTWLTWGSAYTAAGASHIITGAAPSVWRFNVGTKDTGDISVFVDGDVVPLAADLAIQE